MAVSRGVPAGGSFAKGVLHRFFPIHTKALAFGDFRLAKIGSPNTTRENWHLSEEKARTPLLEGFLYASICTGEVPPLFQTTPPYSSHSDRPRSARTVER